MRSHFNVVSKSQRHVYFIKNLSNLDELNMGLNIHLIMYEPYYVKILFIYLFIF